MKKIIKKVLVVNTFMLLSLLFMACSKPDNTTTVSTTTQEPSSIKSMGYGLFDVIDKDGEKIHYATGDGWLNVDKDTYIFKPNNSNYDDIGLTKGKIEGVSGTQFRFVDESGKTFDVTYNASYTEWQIDVKTDTITLCFIMWNDL